MSPMSQQMQNAQKLYMRGIQDGQIDEVHRHYMGASYTQHSTGAVSYTHLWWREGGV